MNETVNNQPTVDGDEILDGVLRWVDGKARVMTRTRSTTWRTMWKRGSR